MDSSAITLVVVQNDQTVPVTIHEEDDFGDVTIGVVAAKSTNVPVKDFWSMLVYDSLSRSELKNGQKFPSVRKCSEPKVNPDGTVDVYFDPEMPAGQEKNWTRTVPGKGWFPIFRFYGPREPLFQKTWELPDIERTRCSSSKRNSPATSS